MRDLGTAGRAAFTSVDELQGRVFKTHKPLPADAIHVWRTALSAIVPLAKEIRVVLSAAELSRAETFRFPELQRAFLAGRGLLRIILGAYCHCAPKDLRLKYGLYGKPHMEAPGSAPVSFNLSHSTDAIQIAVGAQGELGIDIEHLARGNDLRALTEDCLNDEEAKSMQGLNSAQERASFFRYWVHKEAFVKCLGAGFLIPPKDVRVSFRDSGGSVIRCIGAAADEVVLFGRDLPCEPEYVAAIATQERDYTLETMIL